MMVGAPPVSRLLEGLAMYSLLSRFFLSSLPHSWDLPLHPSAFRPFAHTPCEVVFFGVFFPE